MLLNSIEKDKKSTFTNIGVHKDDLVFRLDNHSIKNHGSQGQQKSFLISLKLAQFDFIKKYFKFCPILLLDDIFDKLDDNRVEYLISFINKGVFNQVFITDTNKERSKKILNTTNKDFTIFDITKEIDEK